MKHALPIFILLLALSGLKCRRSNESAVLTGKLVINACGNSVIQVIDGNIAPSRVEKSWTDSIAHKTWSNVFKVSNTCQFQGAGLSTNDTFTFQINDSSIVNNCMVCLIFYPTPSVSNTVTHVHRISSGH